MVGLTQLPLPGAQAGMPGMAVPADVVPAAPGTGGGEPDPLGTVGIALLAYGLVQLLSKVVDKLPVWKAGGVDHPGVVAAARAGGTDGFTPDDRKRLERVLEQAIADHQRLKRLEEFVREVLDDTRWMAEMRARGSTDPLAAGQERLVGQALDELRAVNAKLDNILRKLRALWTRVGTRRKDRG